MAGAAPKRAEGARKFKTVTKTFTKDSAVTIPSFGAADPYPSKLRVRGLEGARIRDVNLILVGFSQTFPDDVDVMLVSPEGQVVTVMSDAGGAADLNDDRVVIDDQATPAGR